MLGNLALLIVVFVVIVIWAHAVATYDWSKFEEDSANDDFLKPIDTE